MEPGQLKKIKRKQKCEVMKILIVSQYYFPEPFRITDICETLVERGHSVTVVTAQPNYPEGKIYEHYKNKYSQEMINGVNVIRSKIHPRGKGNVSLFWNYISFPWYARKIIRKLEKDFDIVLINQLSPIFSALPGIKYANKNKKKIYLYCLDLWPESIVSGGIKENTFIYKFFNQVSKKIYKKVNEILVASKAFELKFQKYGIKTQYLPQYAEDFFKNFPRKKNANNQFHLTFAGNIGEMQSVETIIFAAKELLNYKDIVFDIYGSGSKFEYISGLISNMNLNNVIMHGRRSIEEMPNIYNESDALLVTLKKDNLLSMTLPGKVQTYMASGIPIIGAIDGETKAIIEEARAGYVCEAEDYLKLSELILQAKNNKNFSEMGKNGKKFYNENFSKENFFNQLELIFQESKNV